MMDKPTTGPGDPYETPPEQIVIIRGQSGVEHVSLPMLQQYYTNVQQFNREYGYLKLALFDFPLNDSLTKTFNNDYIYVHVTIRQHLGTLAQIAAGNTPLVLESTDTVRFQVSRTHSSVDIANTLQNHMSQIYDNDNDHRWLQWFDQFYFDGDSQKFGLILSAVQSANYIPYDLDSDDDHYLGRLEYILSSDHMGKSAKLAAALFGGTFHEDGTWSSSFDTGPTKWFGLQLNDNIPDEMKKFSDAITVYSEKPPRMFVDPYVYVYGAPDSSVWEKNGLSTGLLTIQPRNRPAGIITSEQAFINQQSHLSKASLASLRSMTFRFTDSEGQPILLDEDYIVKLSIQFQP